MSPAGKRYKCRLCGYRYPLDQMRITGWGSFPDTCKDTAACHARVRLREQDRKDARG